MKISYGTRRFEKQWQNDVISYEDFIKRLENPVRTAETLEQFLKYSKKKQDDIKDVGGFVFGHLKEGRRLKGKVSCRSALTLDMDECSPEVFNKLKEIDDVTYCYYSTHKHTSSKPRLRLIIPLVKEVTEEEYEPLARYIASKVGMDYFDDTTYQAHRLMYWPSVSSNGEYLFQRHDADVLDPKKIEYDFDLSDISTWPHSSREDVRITKKVEKAEDPLSKKGIVGAFCRTFSIEDVIDKYLSDIYEPTAMEDRYTYIPGESSAGVIIYDHKFAYSHHATDPCSQILCNAFDLVRIHKFGELDKEGTDVEDYNSPSYKKMCDFAAEIDEVKILLGQERIAEVQADFSDLSEENWETKLDLTKNGDIKNTATNIDIIMQYDPKLQNIVYNTFTNNIDVIGDVPWKRVHGGAWQDADLASAKIYFERNYGLWSPEKIKTALLSITTRCRQYHPVRNYLDSLTWDGVDRIDYLLSEYLGAEDNEYTRAVMRKTLTAAVARIYHPGVKFDTVLVLNGPQGIGKSTLFSRLGMAWYSDALSLNDMQDKSAAEKLQGYWILEMSELTGMRKMEVETVKSFITRQDDKYRQAYGTYVESHPRSCIIVGSTNSDSGFLRDVTGNRRFWPVTVTGEGMYKPWDLTDDDVDEIWAEAIYYFKQKEPLFLDGTLAKLAVEAQREAMETDARCGVVQEYLDTLLPDEWNKMDLFDRRAYLDGGETALTAKQGTNKRERVCVLEIWCECFKNERSKITRKDSAEIEAMLIQLGWHKYTGSRSGKFRYSLYGSQITYERISVS